MIKAFATTLLSLIFIVAGVVAPQSAPSAPAQTAPRPAQSAKPPFDPNAPIQLMPAPSRKDMPAQSAPTRKGIPEIAKGANGAIVTIVMANNDKPIARGTGFLVSQDGVVVTNYHVIANGNIAIVKFSDGTALPVDGVLAADRVRDLVIIKIHGKNFRALTLGNSDRVQIGEEVVAIGNPLGLELTVSNGILSGVRTVEKEGGKFLQITAPISHGSSGGPLFNMAGEVVGITSMYFEGGENLNFAIPVNDAKRLLLNQSAKLENLPNEPEEAEAKPAAPPIASPVVPKVAPSNEGVYSANLFGGRYSIKVSGDEMRIITLRGADWFDESVKDTLLKTEFSWNHNVVLYEKDGSYWYRELTFGFNRPNKKNGDFVFPCYFHATMVLHVESESRISGAIGLPADVNLASCVASRTVTVPITFTSKETHATLATPNNPLPPNTKVAATPIGSTTQPGTRQQLEEDMTYCYRYPANNLQTSSGAPVSCAEVNATRVEQEVRCKTGSEAKTDGCRDFLKFAGDLKAGRL